MRTGSSARSAVPTGHGRAASTGGGYWCLALRYPMSLTVGPGYGGGGVPRE